MRAKKLPEYIPSVMRLESILDIDDMLGVAGASATLEPEDPNEIVAAELFDKVKPGNERVTVVLRADGLTYKSIAEIMGLSEGQVKNIVYTIRKRIIEDDPAYAVLAQFDKNDR